MGEHLAEMGRGVGYGCGCMKTVSNNKKEKRMETSPGTTKLGIRSKNERGGVRWGRGWGWVRGGEEGRG